MKLAGEIGMTCVNILGKGGGEATTYGAVNLVVPSYNSQRIQEVHLLIIHQICGLIEKRMFQLTKAAENEEEENFGELMEQQITVLERSAKDKNRTHYGN